MNQKNQSLIFEFRDRNTRELLRELIVYISSISANDSKFGKTKLAKLLYLSNFETFRQTGEPVTGHQYVKLPNGPFPDDLDTLLNEMATSGEIILQSVEFAGYTNPQIRVIPRRRVNFEKFSSQAIAIIDGLVREHWDRNGREMADLSHGIAWQIAELRQPIPYQSSIISDEDLTQEDLEIIASIAEKYGIEPRE